MSETNAQQLPDIVRNVVLNASIEKVWKAVSTAEGIASWFMPPTSFEPTVGYEFELNAGQFGMSPCTVTVVEPPHRLAFRWGKDWTLSFELKEEQDGKTAFTLTHGGWGADVVTEFNQPHTQVREHMGHGWDGIMKKFVQVIEG
ncbi:uncharacterized protein YndB with AHSA1/START domain [Paenibacillus cellulosilyticus]|uniref:Uncharacterized protein YndB with AHSA1/START domain n=1 Tax=Paenibacillus cellulosilyticus TaxID=375489 RepID=A0A2V2YM51_9BACL|nr:SRPBCC domain-containing protein [Paenibacillus cellulosilyticus]PWV95199.1 uncharacterized protein YndB with AHSA1/START domain [Paenibacillus cellulosilyticus]QKS46049.1 SRPBCC domain-containing protein [Paenibacillus cellulosilyticus]